MPEAVNPPNVWQPFGPFSMAMVQGDGRIIHLKGQVALDRAGRIVGAGDMRAQLRQVLENIRAVLESMGGTMGDILSLVHYTTDIESFMKAGDVRRTFFTAPFPAGYARRWPSEPAMTVSRSFPSDLWTRKP